MKSLIVVTLLALPLQSHAARFTLVVHEDPAEVSARSDAGKAAAYWSAWGEYAQAMQAAGVLRGGMPLKPASTRARESVQEVSGVFLIEVDDAEAARRWAARAPRGARVDAREEFPGPAMR